MKGVGLASVLATVLVLAACQAPPPPEPPDLRAESEAAIRGLIDKWVAASAAKDVEAFTSVYAQDAVVMLEDAPDARGMAAIRAALGGMMQDPAFSLAFVPDQVVAARSGDVAYETGSYSLTMSGPDGKPVSEAGQYVVVWRKEADGTWKVVVDAPVSDPPAGAPAS